jgi:hypothetical protein
MEKAIRVLCTRRGDFWEVSEQHAAIAKALELPILTRNGEPSLGIPDHAFDHWAGKLKAATRIDLIKSTGQRPPIFTEREALRIAINTLHLAHNQFCAGMHSAAKIRRDGQHTSDFDILVFGRDETLRTIERLASFAD